MGILATLRKAIEVSGEKPFTLAKAAKISPAALSRFLSGERPALSIQSVESLAKVLGLELKLEKRSGLPTRRK